MISPGFSFFEKILYNIIVIIIGLLGLFHFCTLCTNPYSVYMYLEKLQIQGFKSFAQKNELVFPGMLDKTLRGLTAVVGPNGSGKSNVADAVHWALGKQSMKTLRGKKAEDIIFSG